MSKRSNDKQTQERYIYDETPRYKPPRRAIRAKQVLEIYPVSEAQLYKEIAAGLFPEGFILTPGGRCRAWWEDEVVAIVESRAAASYKK